MYDSLDDQYKNMLTFYNASVYKKEFSSYIDGDDDYFGYYFQSCEMNARAYAITAVEEYEERINEYLGISNDELED